MKELINISFVLMVLGFAACKKSSTDTVVTPKNKLVFIYKTDNSEGASYKTLMEANGCTVTLIDEPSVAGYDFSGFNMIVVGNNTDVPGYSHWSSADSAVIQNAAKPTLLIGAGGFQLASKLKLTVNWGSSAGGSSANMLALNTSSVIYKSPKTITIPANNQLSFYAASCSFASFYIPLTTPSVELIGKDPLDLNYTPVNFESTRFGTFGYYNNINTMTQTGKDFVVNLSYYVSKLSL